MAHIVLMGAGIGGLPAAYEMRDMLDKQHKVTVINAVDYFQFVPSNPWIAVGWRKRDDIVLQLAPLLQRKGIDFIAKAVTAIDPEANQLTVEGGQTVSYDYLSSSPGPSSRSTRCPAPVRCRRVVVATPIRSVRSTMPKPSSRTTKSS